jgi:hypothetical protein
VKDLLEIGHWLQTSNQMPATKLLTPESASGGTPEIIDIRDNQGNKKKR